MRSLSAELHPPPPPKKEANSKTGLIKKYYTFLKKVFPPKVNFSILRSPSFLKTVFVILFIYWDQTKSHETNNPKCLCAGTYSNLQYWKNYVEKQCFYSLKKEHL